MRIFCPRASSPMSTDGPSARMSCLAMTSPGLTSGRWLIQVFWFERVNLVRLYISTPASPASVSSSETRTTIRPASTLSTTPPRRAITQTPESRATLRSMPVPTNGFSAFSVGTAWRCMFDPMSARFASSCSKNGINDAATDTTCLGDTSMKSTFSAAVLVNSLRLRTSTSSVVKRPLLSTGALA